MGWFKRMKDNIATPTIAKKETPEGLWHQCKKCKTMMTADEHKENLWVCPTCEHHERINSTEYFSFLFDGGKYSELSPKLISGDPLKFEDTKKTNVKTSKIDTILRDYNLTDYFLFIKLDVEGHELQAIKGSTNIIQKYNPIFIIELSKYIFENNQDNFIFFKNFLINFDYSIYDINNKNISPNEILNLLSDLDVNHKTIGNYYLIKNNEDLKKLLKND